MDYQLAQYIPWLPALAAALCGICCMRKSLAPLAAPITILGIFASFILTVMTYLTAEGYPIIQTLFEWIRVGNFKADMGYYIDPLTSIMLLVVTGIGTLVAWYAAFYMKGDKGYARFFAAVSLFIFAMTTLVMADNLVLLYLGWEGVGLCSYLLIGFHYEKPSAVAAAKKAFVVNRIGDLAFAMGLMLTFLTYGSVEYNVFLPAASAVIEQTTAISNHNPAVMAAIASAAQAPQWMHTLIPFLLMLGAFGKSAQLPLYVWLPDAMEGPTPVSALIHAATMVTAGVYLIARMLPLFQLSPNALPTVAAVGAATALFAATIALCQYDIKRIFAYSTISQLGYMFLAVGVLSTDGGVSHLFTHAFFKALLFLTAGSVMHALAGQLDLRHMSGLRTKLPVTCWLMFIGCLALAGIPFTAGFFSKDAILAAAFDRGINHEQPLMIVLGVVGLVTAFMTAYYAFRLWFRVFMGPTSYAMGDEHHGQGQGHHDAHEMPALMNAPLVILAIGTLLITPAYLLADLGNWFTQNLSGSTAKPLVAMAANASAVEPRIDPHTLHVYMMIISSVIALAGVALAAWLHWLNRGVADRLASSNRQLVGLLHNKYYVDEACDAFIVKPLHRIGQLLYVIDQMVIHGLALAVGFIPRLLGLQMQSYQNGVFQGYGLGMVVGTALLLLIVLKFGL